MKGAGAAFIGAAVILVSCALLTAQAATDDGEKSAAKKKEGSTSRPDSKPASGPASAPASGAKKTAKGKKEHVRKYATPTAEEVAQVRQKILDIADQARESIDPKLHNFETAHFIVISAYEKSDDKRMGEICEALYKVLCKQFDVEADESVWVGKCGVFAFTSSRLFQDFMVKFHNCKKDDTPAAGVWCASGNVNYIVMNKAGDLTGFAGVLAHEGTHAFMSRCGGNTGLPAWMNEGIAEFVAATVVPKGPSLATCKNAIKDYFKDNRSVENLFDNKKREVGLFDYGIAQSWVRYLIARDGRSFINMVMLLKSGKDEEGALQECFKISKADLISLWTAAVRRGK